jgi:hypothetical protein
VAGVPFGSFTMVWSQIREGNWASIQSGFTCQWRHSSCWCQSCCSILVAIKPWSKICQKFLSAPLHWWDRYRWYRVKYDTAQFCCYCYCNYTTKVIGSWCENRAHTDIRSSKPSMLGGLTFSKSTAKHPMHNVRSSPHNCKTYAWLQWYRSSLCHGLPLNFLRT